MALDLEIKLRVSISVICPAMYVRLHGHIKYRVPLIEKSRASCTGGRSPPSFSHLVIIITGLNNLYGCTFSP